MGVKGRKGRPDCAQWAVNVRPAGYYGNDDAENERAKRAPNPPSQPPATTTRPELAAGVFTRR